jgi:hypothetical protein
VELNVPVFWSEMAKRRQVTPWWLEEGTEICSPCGQAYAYQTEFRCAFCDGPICPFCVETMSVEIACPECYEMDVKEVEG